MRGHREIAVAIVIDRSGQFLLQQRDDIPGILYPGKVGLFGGHREGNETFLECIVRELHEELSYFIPPHRFVPLLTYDGKYWGPEGGTLRGEFYVVRDIPRDQITVTEGALLVADINAVLVTCKPRWRQVQLLPLGATLANKEEPLSQKVSTSSAAE